MASSGTVVVKIIGDASSFKSEMGSAESTLDSVSRKLLSVGTKLTLGVTTPLLLAGKAGATAASDLEQSTGAVESVYGDAADTIFAFGETAAQTAGLSKRQVNEMASSVGASLTGMGYSVDDAATTVVGLQQRAADLAATFGGTTEQAIQAMGSALRGERDPIEQYGVSIKEADVQARILALGLDTSTVAAQKTATATATLDLIMESTAGRAGQFAEETDTAAGATARAKAEAENATAALGEGLLPVVTKLQEWAGKLGRAFGGLSEEWQNAIVVGGLVLAAIGPIVTIVGGLTAAVGALGGAFAFLAANPVVLIIAGIIALVAALIYAYNNSETFRNLVDGAFGAVADAAREVGRVFGVAFGWVETAVKGAWKVIEPIVGFIKGAFGAIIEAAEKVVGAVQKVIDIADKVPGFSKNNLDLSAEQIAGFTSMPSGADYKQAKSAAPSELDGYMGPAANRVTQNVTFNGVTDPATLARMTADELSWAMRGV